MYKISILSNFNTIIIIVIVLIELQLQLKISNIISTCIKLQCNNKFQVETVYMHNVFKEI